MKIKVVVILIFVFFVTLQCWAQISNTKHNLSFTGPGEVKSLSEGGICIFCHTSHSARTNAPLWNRNDPGSYYTMYDNMSSSTMNAQTGQPDGASVLCLSCHDGTIALGSVVSKKEEISFGKGTSKLATEKSNLSTDLSDDHPISFVYDAALASTDNQLLDPRSIMAPVRLDQNSKMQCTSCHDPHDNSNGKFLHVPTRYSELCKSCHNRNSWNNSSHSTSQATWNGSGINPWNHIDEPYRTVSENGCNNCHGSHNVMGKERLMKSDYEEKNCLDCHNGNVANSNIEAQINKTYGHAVYNYIGIHDPQEEASLRNKHVECSDCHNPHDVTEKEANAPFVKGSMIGVRGIDLNGNSVLEAQYEYEVCFRCHADNPVTSSYISRNLEQNNVRLEFNTSNPSFHPVANKGQNENVPSLISPLNTTSVIYCSDCHSSDGNGASGPHTSNYKQLLKLRYETTDGTFESESSYELCYSCHDRNSILENESFKFHGLHISKEKTPCATCHDPHGINFRQGNEMSNTNLINFNTSVVSKNSEGQLDFYDTGRYRGYCNLKCHGKEHNSMLSY